MEDNCIKPSVKLSSSRKKLYEESKKLDTVFRDAMSAELVKTKRVKIEIGWRNNNGR